jgi:hypothetical protein
MNIRWLKAGALMAVLGVCAMTAAPQAAEGSEQSEITTTNIEEPIEELTAAEGLEDRTRKCQAQMRPCYNGCSDRRFQCRAWCQRMCQNGTRCSQQCEDRYCLNPYRGCVNVCNDRRDQCMRGGNSAPDPGPGP